MATKSTTRRRFIAGATCPECQAMDKIVVDLDTDSRYCIACGFKESRPAPPATGAELPTRVNRAAARRVETPAEAVTILDPDKSTRPAGSGAGRRR